MKKKWDWSWLEQRAREASERNKRLIEAGEMVSQKPKDYRRKTTHRPQR